MQKKIFVALVFILIYNISFACDLCTIYIGIQPNDYKNSFSIRHRYRSFEKEYYTESYSSNIGQKIKGIIKDKHSGSSGISGSDTKYFFKESYNSYDIAANIFLSKRLQLNISTYFADNYIYHNDSIVDNIGGIGDLNLIFKYQLLNSHKTGDTLLKNKFLHRLSIGSGVTIPTGNYNKKSIVDFETDFKPNIIIGTPILELDPHLQAGTGSFSFLFLMEYYLKFNSIGINMNTSYKINTTNKNEFRFANRFNSNFSFFSFLKLSKKIKIMPQVGLSYEKSARDVFENEKFIDSGGEVLFSNFGFNLFLNKLMLGVSYYSPIYQQLNGDQPLNKLRLISQINYYF
jgi:hypothetical protein